MNLVTEINCPKTIKLNLSFSLFLVSKQASNNDALHSLSFPRVFVQFQGEMATGFPS